MQVRYLQRQVSSDHASRRDGQCWAAADLIPCGGQLTLYLYLRLSAHEETKCTLQGLCMLAASCSLC
jgi:hypothetical protein